MHRKMTLAAEDTLTLKQMATQDQGWHVGWLVWLRLESRLASVYYAVRISDKSLEYIKVIYEYCCYSQIFHSRYGFGPRIFSVTTLQKIPFFIPPLKCLSNK